ncbi:MAG TPA: LLM class flavin-dependent oxidoreductase [Acidimicrobiia bacterium]|nr:LLM class flavin-dependent oxidoreductase [Acidimicrobiia bacterium]
MRFGVQLPETEYEASWSELREMARVAEESGLDSLWVGDHLLYEEDGVRSGPWEAWALLSGLAAVTSRIALGPLVAALPFHNPAVLAKAAATIDEISGGRLTFGVGAGWNEVEFSAFGLPYERRVARFAEAFGIIRRLLAGERIDFAGEFYQLEGAELFPRPPRPGAMPFMIGSNRPRMLGIALPHVDSWNSWYSAFDNDPQRVGDLVARIEAACHDAGRDPSTLQKSVAVYIRFGDHPPSRRTGGTPWWGSTDEHLQRLREIEAAGIDEAIGILDPITIETIEKFGEIAVRYRGAQ